MKYITKYDKKKTDISLERKVITVGIKGIKDKDGWRELGFKLSSFIKSKKIKKINITKLDLNSFQFIEGVELGLYSFSMKKKNKKSYVQINYIPKKNVSSKSFKKMVSTIKSIVKAQNITREMVNLPANIVNSGYIYKEVKKMFKNVEVEIYNEKKLKKLGMNGHLAVNAASSNTALTIKLTYTPKKYKNHNIYIGKGLTYDSGGYSIKPTSGMVHMQIDKGGAMVLLGLMSYVEKNGSKNKITAYLSIAENMINENAFRPGDILKMKNGKTVLIENTDAEGRLVLFDNTTLAEAENKKFTSITTIATLTGAAIYQFGSEAAGLVGFNNKLKKKIIKAGKNVGELYMNAEFHKYMLNGVDSTVADLTNTGTPNMGCQKAGLFLTNALKKKNIKKYVHIDIAGPTWTDKPFSTNNVGATGFCVRTLINLNC